MAYDGFISYSHAADDRLAPALQRGLQRLAKPWNSRRALRIFRDETGLSTNPHLWSAIEGALDESEWFVLLASPEAAQSEWVNKEVAHCLATKSVDRLLPVVTDGTWEWDPSVGDFTPESSAVPDALRGALAAEPRHLDVRWAHDETDLDLRNSRFRSAVADLAAPMHGVAKDELEGEDIRQHRRARRLARTGVSALAVLVVILVVVSGFAVAQRVRANRQSRLATQQARLANARRLATTALSGARDDVSRSALLAIEANRLVDNAETRGALLSLAEEAAPVREIIHGAWNVAAVAPDGHSVATVGAQGISIVDLEHRTTRSISRRAFGRVASAAFSPDGRLLALGGDDVEILSVRTGAPIRSPLRFRLHVGIERPVVMSLRFSPDATDIAASSELGLGLVWSMATGTELGRFYGGIIDGELSDVAFSPDGRWLAVSGNGGVVLDAHSIKPRYPRPPPADNDQEFDVAFSPDGTRFATATSGVAHTNHSGVVIREAATGAAVGPSILVGTGTVSRLAYSPDGRTVAGALSGGTIVEWDPHSGAVQHDALVGPTRQPVSMSFTRDGSLVVLTTAEIVVLEPGTRLARPIVPPNFRAGVNWLAVSPDGRSIAGADTSGRVRVWDIDSGRLRQTITATTPVGIGATAVAYQPASGIIVVGSGDGTLTAWDPGTGRRLHAPIRLTKPSPLTASTFPGLGVFGVAFDARGRTLVAATGAGRVAVIDPTTWTVRRTIRLIDDAVSFDSLAMSPDGRTVALGGPGKVAISDIDGGHRRELDVGPVAAASMAFQPGGRLLIAGLADGRILSIDATTAHRRSTLVSNHGGTFALALDATGNTLATGGSDGTVTLWNVTDGQPLGPPLTSSQKGTTLFALAFSTHSDSLYASSSDGSLVRYQLQPSRWIDQLCAVIGRNLTPTERHVYLNEPTAGRQTCPNWPAEQ